MPITVELQDMHSYSRLMPAFVIVFIVLSVVAALCIIIRHCIHKRSAADVSSRVMITPANRISIKQKYMALLRELELKYHNGKISNRRAYQELSKIVRHFVYEATGIKVHNYTLQEIKNTNIVGLYEIVNECYTPEFSIDKNGDIYSSIARAGKVVEEWN